MQRSLPNAYHTVHFICVVFGETTSSFSNATASKAGAIFGTNPKKKGGACTLCDNDSD